MVVIDWAVVTLKTLFEYQYFIEATNLSIKVPPIKLVKLTRVFSSIFQADIKK